MRLLANLYIGAILAIGVACFAAAIGTWTCADPVHFVSHVVIAIVASGLKVNLPGVTGSMSVSYVFVLLGMMEFSYPETTVVACLAIAAQSLLRTKNRPQALQVCFNVESMTIAVSIGQGAYHLASSHGAFVAFRVPAAAAAYFLTNTLSVAGVVALTENKSIAKVWKECYFWSFPYYLV